MSTNFAGGVLSRGIPAEGIDLMPGIGPTGGATSAYAGKVLFVDSSATGASDTNTGTDPRKPLATLAGAESLVVANRQDVVIVGAGHAETWASAAASATFAKAGARWVFLRVGAKVATITLGHVNATLTISGASVKVKGFPIFTPSVDSVVAAVTVSAADVDVDIETRDASATVEFVRALITSAGADRLTARIKHVGTITGNAGVNVVRLVGTDKARIELDAYGIFSTAAVEFITTLSSDVVITGYVYNSGTTDGSKLVVNTGGLAATWYADIVDGAAGARFTGGSASALASDDISTANAALTTIQAELSGAAGIASFPVGAAPANGVSLAEALRDVWDALRNGTGGSEPGTNKSIIDAIGFDGVAAVAASAGMLRTMAGTTFVVSKTVVASAIVAAGIDLTAVSTVGAILIEDVVIQNAGTQMDSAANGATLELYTDNVAGSGSFITDAEAKLLANVVLSTPTHTTNSKVVLETGKKVKVKATGEDFTSAGNVTFHIICRRLADNAGLAAA